MSRSGGEARHRLPASFRATYVGLNEFKKDVLLRSFLIKEKDVESPEKVCATYCTSEFHGSFAPFQLSDLFIVN